MRRPSLPCRPSRTRPRAAGRSHCHNRAGVPPWREPHEPAGTPGQSGEKVRHVRHPRLTLRTTPDVHGVPEVMAEDTERLEVRRIVVRPVLVQMVNLEIAGVSAAFACRLPKLPR